MVYKTHTKNLITHFYILNIIPILGNIMFTVTFPAFDCPLQASLRNDMTSEHHSLSLFLKKILNIKFKKKKNPGKIFYNKNITINFSSFLVSKVTILNELF